MAAGDLLCAFTPQSAVPTAVNPAALDVLTGVSTPAEIIPVIAFDDSTQEYIDFYGIVPANYSGGGLTVRIHHGAADVASKVVEWQAAFRRVADDAEDLNTTAQTYDFNAEVLTVPSSAGEVAYDNITFSSGADSDYLAAGEAFVLRITRDTTPSSGTDATGDAYIHSVEMLDRASYESESSAIFSAFTTPPDTRRKTVINTLVASLKADGIWNLLDVLYLMAAADSQAARINWKSPGTFTLSAVNSPTFTANVGYTGNASNMYLNTGWTPSINGVQYTVNSAHIGGYCWNNRVVPNTGALFGADYVANQNSSAGLVPDYSGVGLYSKINGPSVWVTAIGTQGHWVVNRVASGGHKTYRNASMVVDASSSATSITLPDSAFYLLTWNGTPFTEFTDDTLSSFHAGAGLTTDQITALKNAVDVYLASI